MATTADFRPGLCIVHNNELYTILAYQHVKPGKGGAYLRTKLKSLEKGKTIEYTFSVGTKITTARVEHKACQFLYRDQAGYHFMDNTSFESNTLPAEKVGAHQFLKEGQEVTLLVQEETGQALGCELPPFVCLEVTYTEPGLKGDTVTRALKAATVETGANLQVPLFINKNDLIKIDTRTGEYVERVKKQ